MTNTLVTFTVEDFRQDYPQFSDANKYPDRRLESAFAMAQATLDNSSKSLIPYDPKNKVFVRETALYALTCHYLTVSDWALNGQSGAVTSASEGSVSASFSVPQTTGKGNDFFKQTPCGQMYVTIVAPYSMGGHFVSIKDMHPWG